VSEVKRHTAKLLMPYGDGPLKGLLFDSSLAEVVLASDHDRQIAQRDARIAALEAEIEDRKLDHMYEGKNE
jgi:hypothetical protein